MAAKRSLAVLDRFTRTKGMPRPGRVSGGGFRAVYYGRPGKVRVIRGKRVNGTRISSAD